MTVPTPVLFIRTLCLCMLAFVPGLLLANAVQVSPTISLPGADQVGEGVVVTVDSEQENYSVADRAHHDSVYGVTVAQPALVFQTGEQEVPVVTDGVSFVQVSAEGGPIARGDLLVTASAPGVARKASSTESYVFAIALEAYQPDPANQIGYIQADVSVQRAVQALEARQQAMSEQDTATDPVSIVRAVIAVVLVVGGLFFVLYSFRSTIKAGVVSVGRNPRAQSSIVALAIGNLTFALVLCAAVVFIAVAILILPV